MRSLLALLLASTLLACGGSNPPPSPPPPLASPWQVTAASLAIPVGIGNGASYFNFPICADPHTCHISYVERPWTTPLTGKSSITLNYSITGTDPVFDAHSNADNTCEPSTPHVLLIIHQANDTTAWFDPGSPFQFYRWFSAADAQPLTLGDHTLTVPLAEERWTPVYPGQAGQDAGWNTALANVGFIGFGFGGGCFAAHGVAVTSGAARFIINGVGIN